MLQAAARIAAGRCPTATSGGSIRRASPTCWAALHALFGPSLLTWRIVRVLADATRRACSPSRSRGRGAGPRLALAAWAAAILAMAYPSGPHPFPIALALALGALLAFERRPVLAGVLAGACGGVADRVRRFARGLGSCVAQRPRRWRLLRARRRSATAAVLYAPGRDRRRARAARGTCSSTTR